MSRSKKPFKPYTWTTKALLEATKDLNSFWLHGKDITGSKISTDTRTFTKGNVFLALSGENFDGHDYADTAIAKGAVALIVERELDVQIPQLIVSDTRLALGKLGQYRRQKHPNLKVIAITGSSGKTTVKEMLGSVFNLIAPTLMTRGNLNNDLGVPMMLLEISDEHKFAILELGANHIGEIAYTAELAKPDVSCILNIGTAHLGEFGGRDKIAEAKTEIYQSLQPDQVAVVPENDDYFPMLNSTARKHTNNIIGYGKNDITASSIELNHFSSTFTINLSSKNQPNSSHLVNLPLAGHHNVNNALAVTACAIAMNINSDIIVQGLQNVQPPKGRLYSYIVGNHRFVDDAYNANPHSVRASATVIASQNGLKIIVLGDIGELGESAEQEHYQLGIDIANMGIDFLYTVGEFSNTIINGAKTVSISNLKSKAFSDKDSLLNELQIFISEHQQETCTILFKGSRFMKMETLCDQLVSENL